MSDDDNNSKKWHPGLVKKVPPKRALAPLKSAGATPKAKGPGLLDSIPAVQRFKIRETIKTKQTVLEERKTDTELIKADTEQQAAMIENAQTRVEAERYALHNREQMEEAQREIDQVAREDEVEEAKHQLELNRRRRAAELEDPQPQPEPQRKQKPTRRDRAREKFERIVTYGTDDVDAEVLEEVLKGVADEHGEDESAWPEHVKEYVKRAREEVLK